MNFRNLIFPAVLLFGFSASSFAEDSKAEAAPVKCPQREISERAELTDVPPPPPPGAFSREDARMIKRLFLMKNEDLQRLGEFIRRLEKMPPERRKQMAEDFERAVSVKTPEQRKAFEKEMRERFHREHSNLLERYFSSLPPEQADVERKKFLSLDRKARRAYLAEVRRKLGYGEVPPPPPSGE